MLGRLPSETGSAVVFMSTRDKTLARMRNNPLNWRIDDLHHVAQHYGIDWRNEGDSHHVFSFPNIEEDVCIPAHRPLKPVYVRRFVALVDQIRELSQ